MFVSLQNSYVEILETNGTRSWGLWKVLRLWEWSPQGETSTLTEMSPEAGLSPPPREDTARRSQLWSKERPFTRKQPCWRLNLGLRSLQNCEKFLLCVSCPIWEILLWLPKWTTTKQNKKRFSVPALQLANLWLWEICTILLCLHIRILKIRVIIRLHILNFLCPF